MPADFLKWYSATVTKSPVDLKPPQAAVVKSGGGECCGKSRDMISAGKVESGERKRTADEVSKARCSM
jgi:hypothetical protein